MHAIGLADQRFKTVLSSSIGSSNTAAIMFTFLLLLRIVCVSYIVTISPPLYQEVDMTCHL